VQRTVLDLISPATDSVGFAFEDARVQQTDDLRTAQIMLVAFSELSVFIAD
jgi:hypothetical protein